jgi:hypothetical protein
MTASAWQRSERFEEFRRSLLAQPALLDRLRSSQDTEAFIGATVEAAHAMGIELTPEEITAALSAARRDWIERWLQ